MAESHLIRDEHPETSIPAPVPKSDEESLFQNLSCGFKEFIRQADNCDEIHFWNELQSVVIEAEGLLKVLDCQINASEELRRKVDAARISMEKVQQEVGSGAHGSFTHWYDDQKRVTYIEAKKDLIRLSLELSVLIPQMYVTSGKLMNIEEEHGRTVMSFANALQRQDAWQGEFDGVPKLI